MRRCIACGAAIADLPPRATRCSPCFGAHRRQESQALQAEVEELRAEVARLRAQVAQLKQGSRI